MKFTKHSRCQTKMEFLPNLRGVTRFTHTLTEPEFGLSRLLLLPKSQTDDPSSRSTRIFTGPSLLSGLPLSSSPPSLYSSKDRSKTVLRRAPSSSQTRAESIVGVRLRPTVKFPQFGLTVETLPSGERQQFSCHKHMRQAYEVLSGKIVCTLMDIRPRSSTYKKYVTFVVPQDTKLSIPPGVAWAIRNPFDGWTMARTGVGHPPTENECFRLGMRLHELMRE